MTTDIPPYSLDNRGVIGLPDDNGQFRIVLNPAEALALADFITTHRPELETFDRQTRVARGYQLLAQHIAGGAAVPRSANVDWNDQLCVEVDVDDVQDWADRLHTTLTCRQHHTLGSRKVAEHHDLLVEGRWDRIVDGSVDEGTAAVTA